MVFIIYNEDKEKYKKELGISNILATTLIKRGVSLKESKTLMNDPFLLIEDPRKIYGMEKVSKRIIELYQENPERAFLIFADYDVDGMTSGYIMTSCLAELGFNTYPYFPEREEGYGLSVDFANKVIEQLMDQDPVVITVDNGITAYDAAELLQKNNIPVIITDHHMPIDTLNLPGDIQTDPWIDELHGTHLCGAAVAWKVCLLIEHELEEITKEELNICEKYIPYVGIGLITDVMPPHIENKAIVKIALDIINSKKVPLMNMFAKIFNIKNFTVKDIAWSVGPKFNSASRLGNNALATDVFFLQNPSDENELEDKMIDIGRMDIQRKKIADNAIEKALSNKSFLEDPICLFNCEGYPHGIAGIIAGKLAETFKKPALVYVEDKINDTATASCRGYNLDIKSLINLATEEGYALGAFGHSFACGATLIPSCFKKLKKNIQENINKMYYSGELDSDSESKVNVDYIMSPEDINEENLKDLNAYPFMGDYPILFFTNRKVISSTPFKNKEHLVLELGENKYAIGWNMFQKYKDMGYPDKLSLLGKLDYASFSAKTLGLKNNDVVFILDNFF